MVRLFVSGFIVFDGNDDVLIMKRCHDQDSAAMILSITASPGDRTIEKTMDL